MNWHDGKPFTAADVKCTWDLLAGKAPENFKVNFRKGWYANVESVTVNGEHEAMFNLKAPQPALLALLASGFTPVYPCHVSPAKMRQAPIGTGPFKFVEYKAQPGHQAGAQPELLEAGPALSRRHRIHHHPQPLDGDPGLRGRQVRHDLPLRAHGAAGGRRQEPDAERGLRHLADERRGQHADEPGAAVRRSGGAARRRHDARPQEPSSTS